MIHCLEWCQICESGTLGMARRDQTVHFAQVFGVEQAAGNVVHSGLTLCEFLELAHIGPTANYTTPE
jgi:hypothetical protein